MLFSLIDPFNGAQYLSDSLSLMVQWATKLGASRFQIVQGGRKYICDVERADDGRWVTSDPKYQNCELMKRVEPEKGGV